MREAIVLSKVICAKLHRKFESGHCSRILQRSESRNIVCEKCLDVGRGAIEFL